jgi:hypothetical protein
MKKTILFLVFVFGVLHAFSQPTVVWDVLDRDFSVSPWNSAPSWSLEKGGSIPSSLVTQKDGYVNICKTQARGSYYYGFLISPTITAPANRAYTCEIKARAQSVDKQQFPDAPRPASGGTGGYEANQLGFLLNNRHVFITLAYGDEKTGYISSSQAGNYLTSRALNTSEWHVYRLVLNESNTGYDVYVDNELIFENIPTADKSGSKVKIGGESWQRCHLDVASVKIGTGDLVFGGKPRIATVQLSSDSHIANNARMIQVTTGTSSIADGEKLLASLLDENSEVVIPPVEFTVNSGRGIVNFNIPATIPIGKYALTVSAPNGAIGDQPVNPKSIQYNIVDISPLDAKMLPQVKAVDFIKDIDEYAYIGPSKEFIFPSIVDTKRLAGGTFTNGDKPINRYYLFYAPHENPGGIFLSTAPTLDGPWTEYPGTTGMTPGTVIDYAWAERQSDIVKNGSEGHISACQVVWNETQNQYIMYFHGPNSATHYATSNNLVNWTFGTTILMAHQFTPIGAEASYAKAFKHEIPGLNNKYVLMLMNQENQIRRIYWAHSKDGINWTPVTKPLISPDLDYKKVPGTDRKPNFDGGGGGAYGNNASGPFLMERNGRYFVICHDSADNLHVVEVGQSFDMEIHWGEYLHKSDILLTVNGTPRATRPAAVDFIQDDNGLWYMFFEAGGRLDANIAYAKEEAPETNIQRPDPTGITIYPSAIKKNEPLTVNAAHTSHLSVEILNLEGTRISATQISGSSGNIPAPAASGLYLIKIAANESPAKISKIIVR